MGDERMFARFFKSHLARDNSKMEMSREEKRVQVTTLKNEGFTNKKISQKTGLTVRGIQKICKTVKQTNSFKDRPRSGRPEKLDVRSKRTILRILKRTTATAISKVLKSSFEIKISRYTVSGVLNSFGYS